MISKVQEGLRQMAPGCFIMEISVVVLEAWFNTLRLRQDGRHFADDTFKRIFLNDNIRISTEISLKFVPKGPINNILALVQIMAWRRLGDKPLSEPMMVSLQMLKLWGLNKMDNTLQIFSNTGISLGMGSAKERRLYIVTPPLIG